jgi:hypothetical protein
MRLCVGKANRGERSSCCLWLLLLTPCVHSERKSSSRPAVHFCIIIGSQEPFVHTPAAKLETRIGNETEGKARRERE